MLFRSHEARRARLPRARIARLPAVLGGALSGRYSRYSRGAVDVLRDLATPAGPLPVMTLADTDQPHSDQPHTDQGDTA